MVGSIDDRILDFLRERYEQDPNSVVSISEIGAHLSMRELSYKINLRMLKLNGYLAYVTTPSGYSGYKITSSGLKKITNSNNEKKPLAQVSSDSIIETPSSRNYEDPKEVLEFYQNELKRFVETKEYNMIIVTIDRLYVYINGITLSKADRYHLVRAMELLSKQSHSLEISLLNTRAYKKNLEQSDLEWLNEQHVEHIVSAFNDVDHHVDSIVRAPHELKRLVKPIKKNESFLSNFKKIFVFKKYVEIKKIPDSLYEQLIDDINKAYSAGVGPSILILLRKLFESGIKDILWKKFHDDSIFYTSKGSRKHFNDILKDTRRKINEKKFGHFENELSDVLDFVEFIREEGNQSAHKMTFSKSQKEIEDMKPDVKKHLEILFRILNLV